MPEIKVKNKVTGTIKAIDKAVVVGERVKDAYIRTKDKAEHSLYAVEDSPNEYTVERISEAEKTAINEVAQQFDRQGHKGVMVTKANISKAKKYAEQRKVNQPKKSANNNLYSVNASERTTRTVDGKRASVSTCDHSVHTLQMSDYAKDTPMKATNSEVKRMRPSSKDAGRFIKAADQKHTDKMYDNGGRAIETVRYIENIATKSAKTADQAKKTAVKTIQVSSRTAQHTAQTVKASYRTTQVMRTGVKATVMGIRSAAKTSAVAVKAVITATKALIAAITAGCWIALLTIMIVVLFGGVLSIVGGSNVSAALPVSEEVEAYEPLIRQYATEYGILEYVELIKAVMMQESGGRGSDPMQASESGYNTIYPNTPGGITDPEYSIQCGVQAIRDVLERAGVESPLDMERIKLALQGYNFGPGYIAWAINNYGGYSLSNAEVFSSMMAERMGWSRYGDTQYVPHVLRYYVFGRISTGAGNEALVQIALSQEGNSGDIYWSWYGFDSRVSWCACFVSWCANQCGLIDAGTVPKFSLCSDGAAWFASYGRLMDGSYVPSAGDIVFFDWGNDGSINHVGIVEYVANGRVYTIEGNSGDRVRRKDYSLGSSSIYGYGVTGPSLSS